MITGTFHLQTNIEKFDGEKFKKILLVTFGVFFLLFYTNSERDTYSTSKMSHFFSVLVLSLIVSLVASYIIYRQHTKNEYSTKASNFASSVRNTFPELLGTEFIHDDYFILYGLPCCLAYDGRNIIIMNSGNYAVLDWSDIRQWSYEIKGTVRTNLVGENVAQRLQAKIQDAETNASLHAQSGITIQVRDIQHPTWFFPTGLNGKNICDKWMEIFRQIKEGSIPIEKFN